MANLEKKKVKSLWIIINQKILRDAIFTSQNKTSKLRPRTLVPSDPIDSHQSVFPFLNCLYRIFFLT